MFYVLNEAIPSLTARTIFKKKKLPTHATVTMLSNVLWTSGVAKISKRRTIWDHPCLDSQHAFIFLCLTILEYLEITNLILHQGCTLLFCSYFYSDTQNVWNWHKY